MSNLQESQSNIDICHEDIIWVCIYMKWRNAISKHQNSLLRSNSHGTIWLKQEIRLTCVWLVEHFNIFDSWIWLLHNQYNSCSQTPLSNGTDTAQRWQRVLLYKMVLCAFSNECHVLFRHSLLTTVFCWATTIYLQCRTDDGRRLFENVVEQF